MEEIQQLENAESIAIKQLKLRRQNTVREASHAFAIYYKLISTLISMDTLGWSKMTIKMLQNVICYIIFILQISAVVFNFIFIKES